ncbi:MAG TPA: MFS transporter [Xanthobacteraceae bacterium]|jgi:MFS family permease
MSIASSSPPATRTNFILLILVAGCMISTLGFGPRAALGLFLSPMSEANGWGRDVFALALAVQILLWGAVQPVVGAIADRFGTVRVICVGAVLYAAGLALMVTSTTPVALVLSAGILSGIGIAATSFTLVIAAFGKILPLEWRSVAFGAGTAAGSFGQFLFSPLAVGLIHSLGWQNALYAFAAIVLLILPLSLVLSAPSADSGAPAAAQKQSLREALSEAFGHRSYVLLVLGFFTCGFQLLFITVHLPAYLVDRGQSVDAGAWTIGVIGLFNIIGALLAGWLGDRMPKRYLLAAIYFLRSAAVLAFIMFPVTPATAVAFGAVMGLLWLSTVPPTSGLVALMFGTKWFATLFGVAFFSHQLGGFLGVWLGGVLYEAFGSYDPIWWGSIALGIVSALLNMPIVEKPVLRPVAVAA